MSIHTRQEVYCSVAVQVAVLLPKLTSPFNGVSLAMPHTRSVALGRLADSDEFLRTDTLGVLDAQLVTQASL